MTAPHNLQNQAIDKSTVSLNADIRNKVAINRNTILDSQIMEQALVMFQTGFNCYLRDGEMIICNGENGTPLMLVPDDIRQKYFKAMFDRAMPAPKEITVQDNTISEFLETMQETHEKLEHDKAKERASKKLIVIDPESTPLPVPSE